MSCSAVGASSLRAMQSITSWYSSSVLADWLAERIRYCEYKAGHSAGPLPELAPILFQPPLAARAATAHPVWIAIARQDSHGNSKRPVVATHQPKIGCGGKALVYIGKARHIRGLVGFASLGFFFLFACPSLFTAAQLDDERDLLLSAGRDCERLRLEQDGFDRRGFAAACGPVTELEGYLLIS